MGDGDLTEEIATAFAELLRRQRGSDRIAIVLIETSNGQATDFKLTEPLAGPPSPRLQTAWPDPARPARRREDLDEVRAEVFENLIEVKPVDNPLVIGITLELCLFG